MSIRKTQFAPENFYHIFNRGVDKRDIFMDDYDRWRFLQALFLFNDENSSLNTLWQIEKIHGRTTFNTIKRFLGNSDRKLLVRILAYCLMPNHYHLLLEEINPGGISKFMQRLGTGYTMFFNKKHKRKGSLFEGTFKSVMSEDEKQLEYLLFYINIINPAQITEPGLKEFGLIDFKKAFNFVNEYPWSTNQEYLKQRESVIIEKGVLGEMFDDVSKYKEISEMILLGKMHIKTNDKLFID